MKSFFSKVVAFLKKAFGSTKWEQTVITTLNICGPLLASIVAFAGGPAAAVAVTAVISEVSRDLATLMGLVQTYEIGDHATITARIETLIGEVKGNLSTLLTEGHIKDPVLLAKTGVIVNTVSGELNAILKSIPAPVAAPPAEEAKAATA